MKHNLLVFHNLLIFILVSVVVGCTPTKRTASTEIKEKADYSEITNELRTQRTQLDKVTETMIGSIKQTTSRNGGTNVVKQGDTYVYEGVTVQQVDSIVSAQMKQLRSELEAKSTEKKEAQRISTLGYILVLVKLILIVLVVSFVIYNIWDKCDRPNLWRMFVEWVRRVFRRR